MTFQGFAQDERYFRQLVTGQLPQLEKEILGPPRHQFNVQGARYHLDLNDDGIEEKIIPQKRDGTDWVLIQNQSGGKLFEAELFSMGGESHIFKIKFARLSKSLKALIIFLDEGKTEGKKFESTARIYVISFENNDFNSMKLALGPHIFHEKESQREQYFRRDMLVELRDLNNDGTREIVVNYNHIQRILFYRARGEWERF
jgi:hypothetical protein